MFQGMSLIGLIMSSVCLFAFSFHGLCGVEANLSALGCLDDINLVKGMPVTVQIVGGRFGEETAISVAKVIDGLLNR
jgi:Asp-tRNA(Asn)/Glu-tRNA(Gln) amidotransferase A subunit family amidase